MLKTLIIIIIQLAILSPLATADTNSDPSISSGGVSPTAGRGGKRIGGKRNYLVPASGNPNTIRGSCTIIESPTNPLAGTCVNILLILNDLKGNEALRTRTNAQGQFEFTAEPKMTYKMLSGSKFYELIGPTAPIHGGEKVLIQLRQK